MNALIFGGIFLNENNAAAQRFLEIQARRQQLIQVKITKKILRDYSDPFGVTDDEIVSTYR